jgi:hypothetical protein
MKRKILTLLAGILLAFSLGSSQVWAQENVVEVTTTPEVRVIETKEIKGEVVKVEGRNLTIQSSNNQTQEFNIPENIKINRNTMEAELSAIKPGDKVTINQTSDGQILSVETTSGELQDLSKWIIPIGLLAALGLGAGYLMKQARKPHIKTGGKNQ